MHDAAMILQSRRWTQSFARPLTLAALALGVLGVGVSNTGAAPDVDDSNPDLLQWSLEDLGKIKVTTVSRKSESLSRAPAAIYVIRPEEIRRSGINSLPELFRTVPGMEVAQANSHQWAITVRGFNSIFANKLLVLMDGRTLYTPTFSGVYWEETDTVLEDIDRIEVIRGPGAALWGANAVNGVINIMTKTAKETQGVLISGGGGVEERGFGTVRYGGQLGTNLYYRVYAKYSSRDEFTLTDGSAARDEWWRSQGGFRLDWHPSEANTATLQGDYYSGELEGQVFRLSLSPVGAFPTQFHGRGEGANVLGRWTHAFSDESDLSAQVYFDRTDRSFGISSEIRETFDFDAQHRFHLGPRHEIVWGAGYRYSGDHEEITPDYFVSDPNLGLQLFNIFAQDEVALIPDRLKLTLGTKIEHHDFTGFEVQPSARLAWTPHERHAFWAAVSRAVRTPSRSERTVSFYLEPPVPISELRLPVLVQAWGNPDFGSEELLSYEAGYRLKAHERLTLDGAAFYNVYDQVGAATALPAELRFSPEPHLLIPATYQNDLYGESYGFEVSAVWQPLDAWRLRSGYSFLKQNFHTRGPIRSFSEDGEQYDPQQQFSVWSDTDLGRHVEWGIGIRYVDDRRVLGVPNYTALDARLAWKPKPNCELSIMGRNLLDPHHREAAPQIISSSNVQVDRAVYGKLTLRF
ncbi:MAG: TonB-dependent receptor [Verrucomicrobia bacterium]|nr:TonB-dependent receptor [Verrucomicrobiota bacterium]